jgi:hypothetical protein
MRYDCPTCRRQLISRAGPNCVFCGAKIPPELLFTPEEKARFEANERGRKDLEVRRDAIKRWGEEFDDFMNDGNQA